MIYLALIVVAFSIFIIYKEKGDTRLFLFTLTLGWVAAVLCFLIYIQYLERRELYVGLFAKVLFGNRLIPDLPVPSAKGMYTVIAAINTAILLFVYSALCFALSFTIPLARTKALYGALAFPPLLQAIVYSPWCYEAAFTGYFAQGGNAVRVQAFFKLEELLYAATSTINYAYIGAGLGFMIYTFFRTPKMKYFRNYYYFIFSSYLTIIILFASVLWWAPKRLISITSLPGSIHILPVSVFMEGRMLAIFPYAAGASFATLLVSLYRFNHSYFNLRNLRRIIIRSFDVSDSGIRFFNHMVKNYAMAAIVDAESIRDGLLAEHPATVYADRIQRNSQDLLDTLNRVQSKLSISALNLTLLDLRKPMEDALALVRLEGIQVERNMEDPAPKALVDANHLRETLVNILQNAVQSMTGPVRRLRIEIGQSRWWANISISDSGCGIQKEDLHRVFVPFYTTKDRRNNWGLGLPYAYRIVMAHRGKLFIDSEPGNGTMVKILLPLIE